MKKEIIVEYIDGVPRYVTEHFKTNKARQYDVAKRNYENEINALSLMVNKLKEDQNKCLLAMKAADGLLLKMQRWILYQKEYEGSELLTCCQLSVSSGWLSRTANFASTGSYPIHRPTFRR